jgi:hypothetical protein
MKARTSALLIVLSLSGSAFGQKPGADTLFREGRTLMEAHRFAEACDKFAESLRIEPAAGTLLNLADCHEKSGHLAVAWNTFNEAAKAASARNRSDWLTIATKRATAIEPKVALLTIAVSTQAAATTGLRIERDGDAVDKDRWGITSAVDPGAHVITASAAGHKTWTRRVDLFAGQKLITDVPALEPADTRVRDEAPAAHVSSSPPTNASPLRPIGFAIGGVGLVGLGIGVFAALRADSLLGEAEGQCTDYPTRCAPGALGPNDDAATWATVSTVALTAGAVLLASGVVLALTAPRGQSRVTARGLTF